MGALADTLKCFVLGVAHFGKDAATGTKGSGTKEDNADVVLVCLGDRELSGKMNNLRLAVRKTKIAQLGQVYPFDLRVIDLGQDEDGDPITTAVINWLPAGAAEAASSSPAPDDPWAKPKRQDQRAAALRLKRVMMMILAEQGVELSIEPDGPAVRMVEQKLVRQAFYASTPAEGTPKQIADRRRLQFERACNWAAEEGRLITLQEIDGKMYFRLSRPRPEDDEEGLD